MLLYSNQVKINENIYQNSDAAPRCNHVKGIDLSVSISLPHTWVHTWDTPQYTQWHLRVTHLHRVQDAFLSVPSELYAILRVRKMRGDFEVAANAAGRKESTYQIYKGYTVFHRRQEMVAR